MTGATKLPIVVLLSGSGSNLQALIDAATAGELAVEIRAVISNKPGAYGLERARQAGIETRVVEHTTYPSREAFDQALMAVIDQYSPRLLVLAGFMRILTDAFVTHYAGRMLNIHPSLLPKYQGLNTHARAIEAGDIEAGASVHYVTAELDGGPVIIQGRVTVEPGDDAQQLAARVLQLEHRIYPEAIQLIASGQLAMQGEELLYQGQPLREPLQRR